MAPIISLPLVNDAALSRAGAHLEFIIEPRPHHLRPADWDPLVAAGSARDRYGVPHLRVPPLNSRSLRRRAAHSVNAVMTAFVAVWPAVQYGLEPNFANVDALRGLTDICQFILTGYAHNGEAYVAKYLKGLAAWLRYRASDSQLWPAPSPLPRFYLWNETEGKVDFSRLFRGSISRKAQSPKALLRFSRYARALPAGGAWAEAEALDSHRVAVTLRPHTAGALRRCVREVSSRITRGRLVGIERPGFTLSHSASYENSRAEGGAAAYIRRQVWDHHAEIAYTQLEDGSLGLGQIEGLPHEVPRIAEIVHLTCAQDSFPEGPRRITPSHRVLAVPDRGGYKVRVITAGPATLQSLAHQVRKVVYAKVLQRIPTMWALRENGVREFMDQLEIPVNRDPQLGPWVALSCDLKSATDLFPHDVTEEVNNGMEENLSPDQLTSPNWHAWRSLSGPQHLEYPDGSRVTSTCGNMMGTAPSWFLLNVVNLTAIRVAWSIWTTKRWRSQLPVTANTPYGDISWGLLRAAILRVVAQDDFHPWGFPKGVEFNRLNCLVGDDLGSACPLGVAVVYEAVIQLLNGRTSPGKHYVQRWESGAFLLIAEEMALVEGRGVRRLHAEHLRGIVTANALETTYPPPREEPWAVYGPMLSSALGGCRPSLYRAMCSIAHMHTEKLRLTLMRRGLPVYLPVIAGGLGWPHPRGLLAGLERCSIRQLKAYSVLRGFRSEPAHFVLEVARVRACWYRGSMALDYSELAHLLSGYLGILPTSRDEEGRLAPVTEQRPIGLRIDSPDCVLLADYVDKLCMQGVSARYITDLESLDNGSSEAQMRGIGKAARRYNARVNSLLSLRRGHVPKILPRSAYVDLLREDEELLKSVHILMCQQTREMLPVLLSAEEKEIP